MKRKDLDPVIARKKKAVTSLLAFFFCSVLFKVVFGEISGSHTLFVSGMFGLFGIFLSVITLLRMHVASHLEGNIKSDFNQEKLEFVVVASISLLIAFATGALLFSVVRLTFFHRLHAPGILAAWVAASLVVANLAATNYLKGEIKILKEVDEDRLRFLFDKELALSVLVVVVVVLSAIGFYVWDYIAAILVALFIVAYSAFFLLQSFKGLMDATYDRAGVANIAQCIKKADPSLQVKSLKVNLIGQMLEIMATVKLPRAAKIREARNIIGKIEHSLKANIKVPHEVFVGFVGK